MLDATTVSGVFGPTSGMGTVLAGPPPGNPPGCVTRVGSSAKLAPAQRYVVEPMIVIGGTSTNISVLFVLIMLSATVVGSPMNVATPLASLVALTAYCPNGVSVGNDEPPAP